MNHHSFKHGFSVGGKVHPLYNLYYGMMTRCYNASKHNFPYYQGKGIKVCEEWKNSISVFIEWAKENGWQKGLTIDRIDSDKDYEPSNCRFISSSENSKKSIKKHSLIRNNFISKCRKLSVNDIKKIKRLILENKKRKDIAQLFGVGRRAIYNIEKNITYKEIVLAL